MKILFDILGSTEKSGGMRLHSTELVGAWLERFPEDEVIILGGAWAKEEFAPRGARVVSWPNERVVGRAAGQLFASAAIGFASRVDHVISLSPIVSPLVPRKKAVAFQHDWRHKKNPHEFPWHQRLYRGLWEISAKHAGVNVCISQKAARETEEFARGSSVMVIENGRDHARRWGVNAAEPASPLNIVTFGHHNNKRPELVIDCLALAGDSIDSQTRLTILGARGTYAEQLFERAVSLGLEGRVDLPGFVDDAEYQRLLSTAAVVVMASSDEGFGLPIAEAEYFGIPAVIAADSGMAEIFGSYPLSADPNPRALAEVLAAAMDVPRQGLSQNRDLTSWRVTAEKLRAHLDPGAKTTR